MAAADREAQDKDGGKKKKKCALRSLWWLTRFDARCTLVSEPVPGVGAAAGATPACRRIKGVLGKRAANAPAELPLQTLACTRTRRRTKGF